MTAPTELSSGSAPEPVTPEPVAVESAEPNPEPTAPQPRVPEPAEAEPDPEPVAAGPTVAEPELAEPTGAEPDEDAADQLDEHASADLDEPAEAELDEDAWAGADEDAWAGADEGAWAGADEGAGRGRGVSWLVTAAVAVVVIGLAAAVGALAVTTHGFKSKTIVTYRPAAVFRLRAGDCINSSQNGLSATILSCASPHDAEVFATFSLTGSSWPGNAAIGQQASSGCGDRMASYVNPALADAGLTQEYVYPDQKAWQAGVRTVVCEVSAATGQLTGSVRQTG
jgi:Septum formation